MDRSLGRLWPRAQSKIYEEPKKLARLGLATASPGTTGARRRTVYEITARGRRALRDWLARPARGPSLEHEQLLKIFFAEHGRRSDVLAHIEEMRAWALAQREEHRAVGESYLAGTGPFQARAAPLLVTGGFLVEFTEMVLRWTDWAEEIVRAWPEDVHAAGLDRPAMEYLLRRGRGGPEWQGHRARPARPGESKQKTRRSGTARSTKGAGDLRRSPRPRAPSRG
jgi:DNA-binding PadR family transcriptional regulator